MSAPPPARLSAVVPARDAGPQLAQSLPALRASAGERLHELILVDDGSRDDSAAIARALGARVIPSGGVGLGPAHARNVGARAATGELLVFVDADVCVHADALPRILAAFEDPGTTAVYGSYDAQPSDPGFASQYVNLRHHHVHQRASDAAHGFWAGLGAVRRADFLAAGGFDAAAYPEPSIEDIELGRRLRAAGGRIRRVPAIQGTHLKGWSLLELVRTDITRRALPWAALMRRYPGAFDELNVGPGERARALLALALFAGTLAALAGLLPAWTPLPLALAALLANGPLAALFLRSHGVGFALAGLLFHQVYYLYSAAAYAWCVLRGPGQP